jgi:hypothetical protein
VLFSLPVTRFPKVPRASVRLIPILAAAYNGATCGIKNGAIFNALRIIEPPVLLSIPSESNISNLLENVPSGVNIFHFDTIYLS